MSPRREGHTSVGATSRLPETAKQCIPYASMSATKREPRKRQQAPSNPRVNRGDRPNLPCSADSALRRWWMLTYGTTTVASTATTVQPGTRFYVSGSVPTTRRISLPVSPENRHTQGRYMLQKSARQAGCRPASACPLPPLGYAFRPPSAGTPGRTPRATSADVDRGAVPPRARMTNRRR